MSTAPVDASAAPVRRTPALGVLQRLGRSLMLPIAALPVAALLLRLGQPDMLGDGDTGLALGARWPWLTPVADVLAAAGDALFANLGLLFAVGVAIGFARRSDGSTALAAVVGYLVFDAVTDAMSPYVLDPGADPVDYGVFGGILVGIATALLWQRYHRIRLPPYLAFFGGRRFVPIVTACVALALGVLLSFAYPAFDRALTSFGTWLVGNSILGAGLYGVANRLLVPLGLHHLLNSVPWFAVGSYQTTGGGVVHGDIARFLSGDPTAGAFMTGFFPIMMFALPAAALAIYQEAAPGRRKVIGGVMLSGALTSFLDRRDRAPRVRVHVRGLAALPDPRRAHRHVAGPGQRDGHQGRLRVLGGRDRLRPELHRRDAPAADRPRRAGLRGGLLPAVPVRDPPLRAGHARSRRRRGRLSGRLAQERLERREASRRVALDRALADPQLRGGLGHREAEPVPQEHCLALHQRQPLQGLEQLGAVLDRQRLPGRRVRPSSPACSRRHGRRESSMFDRTMIVRT